MSRESKQIEEIKPLDEFWQCTNTAFEGKCNFRVCRFITSCKSTSYLMWHSKVFLIAYFMGNIFAKNIKIRSHVSKL